MNDRVEWTVTCDAPGCTSTVGAIRSSGRDREAIEAALARAVDEGWFIATDRFIRARADLCPRHPHPTVAA